MGSKFFSFCLRLSTQLLFLIVGFRRTQHTLLPSKSISTTVTQMPIRFLKQTLGKKEAIAKTGLNTEFISRFCKTLPQILGMFARGCLMGFALIQKGGNYTYELCMKCSIHSISIGLMFYLTLMEKIWFSEIRISSKRNI